MIDLAGIKSALSPENPFWHKFKFLHLLSLVFLLGALAVTVNLVQQKTTLFPKAYEEKELLTAPWLFVGNNGADEKWQNVDPRILLGRDMIKISYNLHGLCALTGDASAIIIDQPTGVWHYISLADYGKNCYDGEQTVDIPLANFPGLDPTKNVGQSIHGRFWSSGPFTVDVTSIVVYSSVFNPPTPTPTPGPPLPPVEGAYLKSVDIMKLAKDVVNNQPDDALMETIVSNLKAIGVNYIAFSVPLNSNAEFIQYGNNPGWRTIEQFTAAWTNAIHNAGLNVLFRGTFAEFERGGAVSDSSCGSNGRREMGLYNFPFYVAGDPASGGCAGGLQTQQWWLNKVTDAINRLAPLGVFKSGDMLSFFPEPQSNHSFWDTKWNFLGMNNDPSLYGSFFAAVKNAEDLALAANGISGVRTGYTTDNGSMFLSGPGSVGGGNWYPQSLVDLIGYVVVDHYGSDQCGGHPKFSVAEMECGMLDIYSHYQKPIIQEEWASNNWNSSLGPETTYLQSMFDMWTNLHSRGIHAGLNYWDTGCDNPGSVFNCDYTINFRGELLKQFFAANTTIPTSTPVLTPTPTPKPSPTPTPTSTPTPRPTPTLIPTSTPTSTPTPIPITPEPTPTTYPSQVGFLSGVVTDQNTGLPLTGVRITVSLSGVKGQKGVVATTTTNSSGNYSLGLNPGNYSVSAQVSSYVSQSTTTTVILNQTTTLNFSLGPTAGKKPRSFAETILDFFSPVINFFGNLF